MLLGGGGSAHTPLPTWGGARGTPPLLYLPVLGGGTSPCLGRVPPPSYVPADGGGDEAAGTRPAPAGAHCRAVQRGSVHLFSRVVEHAALEETPLPGSHPVVVCGLTCLLGRATSLTVPMPPSPPAGAAAPDASASLQEQLDALRAQLAGTEAALATANDQLLARHNLAALDLARQPAAPPPHGGLYPPAGQGAPDGSLAAGHAAAAGTGSGAPAHLPLAPAAGAHDGAHDDDFLATYDDEGASSGGDEWAATPFHPHGVHPRPHAAGSGGHRGGADFTVDDFDRAKRPTAGDYLRSFTIPHDVRRADGLPVPFKPVDNVHATDFASGSRDEHEARHWYQLLAWVQQLHKDALRVQHTADLTVQQYAAFTDYVSVSSRRIFSIGAARYDYLAMRQTEPSLAECRITRPSPRPLAGPEVVGTPGDANDVSRPGSDRWRCRCWVGS